VQGNNVVLQWSPPESEQPIINYYIYRDGTLLAELQQTTYLDENLPNGSYTYHVRAMYVDSCESLSYNTVKVKVAFTGIGDISTGSISVQVYPNPTDGMLYITGDRHCGLNPQSPENDKIAGQARNDIKNVEIFDVFGRAVAVAAVETHGRASLQQPTTTINISHLPAGMYFVRIQTENGMVTRKVVKR